MRQGATYYLFAVNTKEEPVSGVSLQINVTQVPLVLDTLFEGDRQVGVSAGQFTDAFSLYEVDVYRWETGSPFIDRLKPRRRFRCKKVTILAPES
jgi:hypothetical protein